MKKLSIFILMATFGLTSAIAQIEEVQFGVRAGVNLSSLSGENHNYSDDRVGFHAGVMTEIPMDGDFALELGLLYSQSGTTFTQVRGKAIVTNEVELDYVILPVMFKYYFNNNLSIDFGGQAGYNLSAKTATFIEGDASQLSLIDIKDGITGFDMGGGGGISFKLDNGLLLQARYIRGFANINDTEEDNRGFFWDNTVNSTLSFSIGYFF